MDKNDQEQSRVATITTTTTTQVGIVKYADDK